MKQLLAASALAVLFVSTPVFGQQVPSTTKCNDESALVWDMNSETDMDHYNVYSANAPITSTDPTLILLQVLQPTSPGDVTHPLNSQLAEGPKYFRVTAVDTVGNESGLSNEAGCDYNLIPATPGSVTIILQAN